MTRTNIGALEATLRASLAALLVGVALPLAVAFPRPLTAGTAAVTVIGSGLLIKSSVTRYCPIHKHMGVDTSDATVILSDGGNRQNE